MEGSGRLRWAVDLGQWTPSDQEFDFLCTLIPAEDATECRKFRFRDDQKRALVSRLLQRHAAATVLAVLHETVVIKRTKGRKPYAANPAQKPHAPNFNYSVSHEGDYVVLAAEGVCVCGCDIAAPNQMRRSADRPLEDVLSAFKGQLTQAEWKVVRSGGADETLVESNFRQFWSLKEVGQNFEGKTKAGPGLQIFPVYLNYKCFLLPKLTISIIIYRRMSRRLGKVLVLTSERLNLVSLMAALPRLR